LTIFLLLVYPREEENIMNTVQRTPEQWNRYGVILVTQARELAEKLGQPVPPAKDVDVKDRADVEDAVSEADELLANIRLKRGDGVDPVAWERIRVEDGRTGEEIFDRLGELIYDFSQMSSAE